MTKTHDIGVSLFHDPVKAFFIPVFEEVFIYTPRTSMNQQQIEFILI